MKTTTSPAETTWMQTIAAFAVPYIVKGMSLDAAIAAAMVDYKATLSSLVEGGKLTEKGEAFASQLAGNVWETANR